MISNIKKTTGLLILGLIMISCFRSADAPTHGFIVDNEVTTLSVIPAPDGARDTAPRKDKFKSTTRSYYTDFALRIDSQKESVSTIYRFDTQRVFTLDHNTKTYSVVKMPETTRAESIKEKDSLKYIVRPTLSTRKVGIYECELFKVHISRPQNVLAEICLSTDVKVDLDIYKTINEKMSTVYPDQAALTATVTRLGKGFPVEVSIDSLRLAARRSETVKLVGAEIMEIPGNKFYPPKDYKNRSK